MIVFFSQVDKADLIQGPTLAELNANEDTLIGDLNFDDLLLPEESIQPLKPDMLSSTGCSLFGNSISSVSQGFASSSFPQSTLTYRGLNPITFTSNFGLNSGIGLNMDNMDAVSPPPAFPSPEASNALGTRLISFLMQKICY